MQALAFFSAQVSIPAWLFWLLIGAIVILSIILWSLTQRKDPRLDIDPRRDFRDQAESIAGLTHGTLIACNNIEVLQDERYFESVFEAISRARQTINFETYLWREGEISDRVTDLLVEKARRGVAVRVQLDASGGSITSDQKRALLDAGVAYSTYHPFHLSNLGRINNRNHRKIVVVDGRIGFVGGHCFTDDWWEARGEKPVFRDISIRVEGPIVGALQSTFSENWVEETGDVFVGQEYFPELREEGDIKAHVARVTPSGTSSAVKLLHYLAIVCSRERIRIQNPYFLPDPEGIEAMRQAVDRGVDIRVMVPSASATDIPIVQHASHHRFGAILRGGVRIFEYERTLLHQKVITVDGVWCGIGSANVDDRSFEVNDEVTVGIWDRGLARQMEETFERDLEHCREVTLEMWKGRGAGHKLLDALLFVINEQL